MALEVVYVCDAYRCIREHRESIDFMRLPRGWKALNIADRRKWHLCPEHAAEYAATRKMPQLRSR